MSMDKSKSSLVTEHCGSINAQPAGSHTVGMRLICFPWAGGNPANFEKLSYHIPDVHCVGVIYPGRLNRCREKLIDIRVSAQEIAIELVLQGLVETPFCLLGHGLGALFAYEVDALSEQSLSSSLCPFHILHAFSIGCSVFTTALSETA